MGEQSMITKEDIDREMKHIRDSQNKDRLYQASRIERIKVESYANDTSIYILVDDIFTRNSNFYVKENKWKTTRNNPCQ